MQNSRTGGKIEKKKENKMAISLGSSFKTSENAVEWKGGEIISKIHRKGHVKSRKTCRHIKRHRWKEGDRPEVAT